MRRLFALTAAALLTLGIAGCGGDDGATGPQGPPGAPGTPGTPGAPGGTASPTANAIGDLNGDITAVTIDPATGIATVSFTVKNASGSSVTGATNFEFTIAKLIPATNQKPAYWQSYINRSVLETGGARVLRAAGERRAVTEVSPGNYTYSFCTSLTTAATFKYYGSGTEPAGSCAPAAVGRSGVLDSAAAVPILAALDVAYTPTATHRIGIAGRDGSGATLARYNAVIDFVPAQLPALQTVAARQVVTDSSCGACHAQSSSKRDKLEFPGFHGNRRYDIALCTTCHNPQTYDSVTSTDTAWKTLDLKVLVHDLHAAHFTQGGSFGGVGDIRNPSGNVAGLDTGLPAGQRPRFNGAPGVINCRNCHDNGNDKILPFQPTNRAAADKTAWQTNVSQQACGSCHDGTIGGTPINFANHFGNQADNSQCALCHGTDKSANVNGAHTTPYSTPNNPFLYPGAKIVKYEISSLTVAPATGIPTVKFRILVGDTESTLAAINLKSPPAGVCVLANCQNANSASGLNFKLAWAKPMGADPVNGPRITSPADWNNWTGGARTYWNDGDPAIPNASLGNSFRAFDQPVTAANMTALIPAGPNQLSDPDANGYHTVVLPVGFPPDPVYSTLTLKAVALESYLVINNYNISGEAVIKGVDGSTTTRRAVVDMENCTTCHERIGFHSNAGRAQNADYCAACHNAEITNSNFFSGMASIPALSTPVKFQVVSNNFKDMIHATHAGAQRKDWNPDDPFNFIRGNPAGGSGQGPLKFADFVYPAQVKDCQTCHLPNSYSLPTGAGLAWSAISLGKPVLDPDNAVGDVNPAAGEALAAAGLYDPLKTVRIGPAQAACGSCHNSTAAKSHYLVNSSATGESCAVCHGPGAVFEAHKQ